MNAIAMTKRSGSPRDFTLAVHVSPGDTYEWSKVLLARAHLDGTLELLTAAWELVLGFGRREFEGKKLSQLMGSNKTDAAILDERNMDPVDAAQPARRSQTLEIASPARRVRAQGVHRGRRNPEMAASSSCSE